MFIHKTSLSEQEDYETENRQAYVNETVVSEAVLYPTQTDVHSHFVPAVLRNELAEL